MKFDEFFITFILLGLTIEELNHMITIPRDFFFILLDCHYMLLGITDRLWDQRELF